MSTPWHNGRLLAFDVESTGPDPDYARIVTATVIELGPNVAGGKRVHEWLANPGVPIPAGATAVHGITTERAVEDGTDPAQVVFELLTILGPALGHGIPVVAFNAAYDLTVLDRECRRHKVDTLSRRGDVAPIIDPHVIDKAVDKYRKGKRTLAVTCERYGIDLGDAHDATADALGAARLAWKLAEAYPDELQRPLPELHDLQVGWRAEQAASLATYFARQGKPQSVSGAWPVQPLPQGWDPAAHPVESEAVAS